MEDVAQQGKFSCGGCGKTYKWKPELAGKKAKCKCGHVMSVPKELAPEEDGGLDDLYALAEDASARKHEASTDIRCPSCGSGITPGEAMCTSCGFNLKTGRRVAADMGGGGGAAPALAMAGAGPTSPILGYQGVVGGKKHLSGKEDDVGDNNMQEYWIPLGLIGFGLIVTLLQFTQFTTNPMGLGLAMVWVIISTVIDLVLMLIGCLVAVKLLDLSFGSPGSALLKLAAISLAPDAIGESVSFLFSSSTGMFVGWAISLVCYYILFSYLFDLDGGEVLLLTAIVALVRMFIGTFILAAVLALIAGAAMSGGGGGGGGGGSGSVRASAMAQDAEVQEQLDTFHETEAQSWLEGSGGRLLGKEPRDQSLAMIKNLYDMGADKILVFKDGGQAHTVIIVLPSAKKKDSRAKIFEWYDKNCDKYGWEETEDVGQKYLVLDFDPSISSAERAKFEQQFKSSGGGKSKAADADEDDEQ